SRGSAAVKESLPAGCDWLVVDHYGWSVTDEIECRDWARSIMVIDDLANRSHDCDVLLDQTFDRLALDYRSLVPAKCTLLVGSQYALLRSEFARRRSSSLSRRHVARLKHVMVAMGLTDPVNATATVLAGVLESGLPVTVDVVLGP